VWGVSLVDHRLLDTSSDYIGIEDLPVTAVPHPDPRFDVPDGYQPRSFTRRILDG
jgi:hypothetical protein